MKKFWGVAFIAALMMLPMHAGAEGNEDFGKSAVAQMQGAGITHIYELAAGLNDWTAEGHPIQK